MKSNSNKELERELKALANKRRLAIIKFLRQNKEATVGDIAEAIKLSFKSTSKHLAVLKAVDIVEYEQRSLSYYYKLAVPLPSASRAILSLL
jgi:DNA-binding transcriptional ArsR family regulator